MKRIILIVGLAILAICAYAQVATIKRTISFKVVPNANLNASTIRIASGELGLNRRATFTVELLNTNGVIIDRSIVTFTRSELRQWLNATNGATVFKGLIAEKLGVTSDDKESVVDSE